MENNQAFLQLHALYAVLKVQSGLFWNTKI